MLALILGGIFALVLVVIVVSAFSNGYSDHYH